MLEQDGDPAPEAVEPGNEVVVAYGPGSFLGVYDFEHYSPFFRPQPHRVIRAMSLCPPIRSSLSALKSTILSGDFQFTPSLDAEDSDAQPDSEVALSTKVLEQCRRAALQMPRPLEAWAWEMLDACMEREKLSETVLAPIVGGIDAGLNGIEALKVKPRWSYRYRVNRQMTVRGIDAWTVDGWRTLDPKHFAWFSWEPREGNPHGQSLADAMFHAFNMLMQLWPEFYEGNRKVGTPSIAITAGEHSKPMVTPRNAKNEEIPGARPVTIEYSLAYQGAKVRNNGAVGLPYGSTVKVIESSHDTLMVNAAIELLEAQLVVVVLLQTRATREAQHGSKADSESGTGVLTTYAQFKRHELCEVARRPFFELVEANYDTDIAMRHTPRLSLGKTDPRTFAAIAQSIGVLYQSGFFTEGQLRWIDAYLGLPARKPGEPRVGPQKDNAAAPPDPKATPAIMALHEEILAILASKGMPRS